MGTKPAGSYTIPMQLKGMYFLNNKVLFAQKDTNILNDVNSCTFLYIVRL